MWQRAVRCVACTVVLGALASAPAFADPIQITGGQLTGYLPGSSFTFTGDGLALAGSGDSGSVSTIFLNCRPCSDANPVTVDFGDRYTAAVYSGQPGTFEGVTYPATFLNANLEFTGPSFSTAILSPSNLILTAPFSMMGTIDNYASNPLTAVGPPLFTASVFGSGTVTAQFTAVPNGDGQGNTLFDVTRLTYQFEAAAPTPEPASLLLLGTGAAGLIARRRRQRGRA